MPADNAKRKQNRLAQYNKILQFGTVVDNPCEYCSSHFTDCVMDPKSRNCAECTRRGRRCVREFHSEAEWKRVLRESEAIDKRMEEIEKQQVQLTMEMLRLRKQRRLFKARSDRMSSHDDSLMEQFDAEDPLTAEDLAELDREADLDLSARQNRAASEANSQVLAATSEDPTLTQMIASADPSLSLLDSVDFDAFLRSVPQGVSSPSGSTVQPAGGSPSGS